MFSFLLYLFSSNPKNKDYCKKNKNYIFLFIIYYINRGTSKHHLINIYSISGIFLISKSSAEEANSFFYFVVNQLFIFTCPFCCKRNTIMIVFCYKY